MKTLTEARNELKRKHSDESAAIYIKYLMVSKWVSPMGDAFRDCDTLFHDGHMKKKSVPLHDAHGNFRGFRHYFQSIYSARKAFADIEGKL